MCRHRGAGADAHWDVGWREFNGFAQPVNFSYLNDLRHVANLLGFRGRYQVAHQDWDGAIHALEGAFRNDAAHW